MVLSTVSLQSELYSYFVCVRNHESDINLKTFMKSSSEIFLAVMENLRVWLFDDSIRATENIDFVRRYHSDGFDNLSAEAVFYAVQICRKIFKVAALAKLPSNILPPLLAILSRYLLFPDVILELLKSCLLLSRSRAFCIEMWSQQMFSRIWGVLSFYVDLHPSEGTAHEGIMGELKCSVGDQPVIIRRLSGVENDFEFVHSELVQDTISFMWRLLSSRHMTDFATGVTGKYLPHSYKVVTSQGLFSPGPANLDLNLACIWNMPANIFLDGWQEELLVRNKIQATYRGLVVSSKGKLPWDWSLMWPGLHLPPPMKEQWNQWNVLRRLYSFTKELLYPSFFMASISEEHLLHEALAWISPSGYVSEAVQPSLWNTAFALYSRSLNPNGAKGLRMRQFGRKPISVQKVDPWKGSAKRFSEFTNEELVVAAKKCIPVVSKLQKEWNNRGKAVEVDNDELANREDIQEGNVNDDDDNTDVRTHMAQKAVPKKGKSKSLNKPKPKKELGKTPGKRIKSVKRKKIVRKKKKKPVSIEIFVPGQEQPVVYDETAPGSQSARCADKYSEMDDHVKDADSSAESLEEGVQHFTSDIDTEDDTTGSLEDKKTMYSDPPDFYKGIPRSCSLQERLSDLDAEGILDGSFEYANNHFAHSIKDKILLGRRSRSMTSESASKPIADPEDDDIFEEDYGQLEEVEDGKFASDAFLSPIGRPMYNAGQESWTTAMSWFPEYQASLYVDCVRRTCWCLACHQVVSKTGRDVIRSEKDIQQILDAYGDLWENVWEPANQLLKSHMSVTRDAFRAETNRWRPQSPSLWTYTSLRESIGTLLPHMLIPYPRHEEKEGIQTTDMWKPIAFMEDVSDTSKRKLNFGYWPVEVDLLKRRIQRTCFVPGTVLLNNKHKISNIVRQPSGIYSVDQWILQNHQIPSILHSCNLSSAERMTLLSSELRSRLSQQYMMRALARVATLASDLQLLERNNGEVTVVENSLNVEENTETGATTPDQTFGVVLYESFEIHKVANNGYPDEPLKLPVQAFPGKYVSASSSKVMESESPITDSQLLQELADEETPRAASFSSFTKSQLANAGSEHSQDHSLWPHNSRIGLNLRESLQEAVSDAKCFSSGNHCSRPLQFESRFESGNLRSAVQVGPREYELLLEPDTNTTGHTQWFFFRVTGIETELGENTSPVYTFHIVNLEKPGSSFNDGMRPLVFVDGDSGDAAVDEATRFWPAPTRGVGWKRLGFDIVYYPNQFAKQKRQVGVSGTENSESASVDDVAIQSLYTESWRVQFPKDCTTAYFAYCYPYTYTDLSFDTLRWQHRSLRIASGLHVPVEEHPLNATEGLPAGLVLPKYRDICDLPMGDEDVYARLRAMSDYNVFATDLHENDHLDPSQHCTLPLPQLRMSNNGDDSHQPPYFLGFHGAQFSSSILSRSVLCHTLSGNPVPLFTITDFPSGLPDGGIRKCEQPEWYRGNTYRISPMAFSRVPTRKKPVPMNSLLHARPYIILSARVHPGESNASWMMRGVLDFLTSSAPIAVRLRSRCIIKVVPFLNPDGVINGHHRTNLAGLDLNRNWSEPNVEVVPPVWNLKQLIETCQSTSNVILYCDFHGHSRRKNIFMFGCEPASASSYCKGPLSKPNVDKPSIQGWTSKLFPRLLARRCQNFSTQNCSFKVQKTKSDCSRVAVWRDIPLVNSYTIEASFAGADQRANAHDHFQTRDFEELGHHFCEALDDLLQYYHEQPERAAEGGAVPRVPNFPYPVEQLVSLPPSSISGQTHEDTSEESNNEEQLLPSTVEWFPPPPFHVGTSLENDDDENGEEDGDEDSRFVPNPVIQTTHNLAALNLMSTSLSSHVRDEVNKLSTEHTPREAKKGKSSKTGTGRGSPRFRGRSRPPRK